MKREEKRKESKRRHEKVGRRERAREGKRTEDGVDDLWRRSAIYATQSSCVYESIVDGGLLEKESDCSEKREKMSRARAAEGGEKTKGGAGRTDISSTCLCSEMQRSRPRGGRVGLVGIYGSVEQDKLDRLVYRV